MVTRWPLLTDILSEPRLEPETHLTLYRISWVLTNKILPRGSGRPQRCVERSGNDRCRNGTAAPAPCGCGACAGSGVYGRGWPLDRSDTPVNLSRGTITQTQTLCSNSCFSINNFSIQEFQRSKSNPSLSMIQSFFRLSNWEKETTQYDMWF